MKAQDILKINNETCLKCGGCVASFPNVFEFDQNQNVLIKKEIGVEPDEISKIKAICPVSAIIEK